MKARAPVLGGNFAVWGGLFSTFDCTLKGLRQKEDPWNSIIAGAAAGGILAFRGGAKAAAISAAVSGTLLALIEGVGIAMSRFTAEQNRPVMPTVCSGGGWSLERRGGTDVLKMSGCAYPNGVTTVTYLS